MGDINTMLVNGKLNAHGMTAVMMYKLHGKLY